MIPPKDDPALVRLAVSPPTTTNSNMTAEEYYQKGNAFRRQGLWHEAINCYIEAARLDPDSPAVEAKRMLDDIMNFYCKDMYNP